MHPGTHPCGGFTLMEIMVALVIFSMIGVGAFGVLTNLQRSQAVLEEHSAQLEALQRLALLSRHDLSEAACRNIPGASPPHACLQATPPGTLAFVSPHWRNPTDDTRSTVAIVRYSMEGGELVRQVWPIAMPQAAPALQHALAGGVQAVQFRSIMKPSQQTPQTSALPAAIDMTVLLPPFGEVRQLIPLVQTP